MGFASFSTSELLSEGLKGFPNSFTSSFSFLVSAMCLILSVLLSVSKSRRSFKSVSL